MFSDGFDFGFTLRHDVESIVRKGIPNAMLTDSESLFQNSERKQ